LAIPKKPRAHALGKEAEARALDYLLQKGYTIRACNYRFEKGEVDIIAQKDDFLLFIEVKVRTNLQFGFPEEFVSERQQAWYQEVATHYIEKEDWKGPIRFDIIAMIPKEQCWEITHLQDAFY
jgi:putative endonuclease